MTELSDDHTETSSGSADVQKVVRHSLVYGVGVVVRRVGSVLMLPIYTRYLSTEQYGTLELLAVTIDIVALVLGMGLNASVFRFYARADTERDKHRLISTIVLLMIALSFVGAAVGIGLAGTVSRVVFSSAEQTYLVQVVFATFFFLGLSETGMTALQARHASTQYVACSSLQLGIQLSVTVYLLVFRDMGVLAVLYGNLAAQATVGVYLTWATLYRAGLHLARELIPSLVRYAFPLVLDNIGAFILGFGDRYFLNHLSSTAEVGLYALSYKFGFMMLYLMQPFRTFWAVERFEVARRADAAATYRRYFVFYLGTLLFMALGLSTLARDVIRVMAAPEFHQAYHVIWILVAAYVVHQLSTFCMIGVLVAGKTEQVSVSTWTAAILCLAMNYVLVPRYHSYGAAVATILPFLVRFGMVLHFSQRHLRIDYDWGAAARLVGISGGLLAVSLNVQIASIPLSVAFNVLLICLMPVAVYFSGVLRTDERQALLQVVLHPGVAIRRFRGGDTSAG